MRSPRARWVRPQPGRPNWNAARGPRLQRRHRRQGLARRGGATGQTAPRHGRKNRKTWKLRGKVGGSRGEPCPRSEEHTSELQSLMRNSSAVFCLNKKTTTDKK